MKKILILALVLITTSCGPKNVAPNRGEKILKAEVSQYTDITYRQTLLDQKTVFNFIPSTTTDLKTNTLNSSVIQHCSEALAAKSYTVKINAKDCVNCIDIITTNSDDKDVKDSSLAECFTEANPNQNNCFGGLAKTYIRSFKLDFIDPKTKKNVHSIETSSEGPSDSITKVAKEMCFASFIDFPEAAIKKKHTVPYPLVEKSKTPATQSK